MSNAAVHMDRMYRWQRHIYDVTRKPYLLGRDKLIASLGVPEGGKVLEIGCGTGRNLVQAAQTFPGGRFYGFDISNVMLEKARSSIAHAGLAKRIETAQGDATQFDPQDMFGQRTFDRIFISYSLSMIPDWWKALDLAAGMLAPGGALLIADFHDSRDLPAPFRHLLFRWLKMFSVEPRLDMETVLDELAIAHGLKLDVQRLYGGYAIWAMLRRPYSG
ncbi:MAG: class I SAM-dependent methyltransferase [Beijerinckiaceae bacterium]